MPSEEWGWDGRRGWHRGWASTYSVSPCFPQLLLYHTSICLKITFLCNAEKNNEIRYLLRVSELTLIVIFYLCTNEKFS